ncbi:MAG: histidine phosphatase family protein [Candidatus Portnoybacteria bacterium]|nr:histidine phosphatase family protein [Candidatus Portnoybacteria bacterium]
MKPIKIYLVRHGEVVNHKNIIYGYLPMRLSEKGKAQAKKAGMFLRKKNISVIFSSPQKRTQETAKIIKKAISKKSPKIIIDRNLRESGFGQFMKGMTAEQVAKKYPKIWQTYWRKPATVKAGESLVQQAKRFLFAINKAVKKYPGQNLVFVSHRDPILAALLKISKRSFNDLHQVKHLCDKGSILEVNVIGRRFVNKSF